MTPEDMYKQYNTLTNEAYRELEELDEISEDERNYSAENYEEFLKDYDEESKVFKDELHSYFVADDGVDEGFVNLIDDPTKSIRKYAVTLPVTDTVARSFPSRVAQIVNGQAGNDERIHTINYKPVKFPVVKYSEVSDYKELITDRIVLLGTTQEEKDKYYELTGKKRRI